MGILTFIAEEIASLSVGTVVGNVIKATTPKNLSKLNKIGTVIGSAMISGVLGDLAVDFVEKTIKEMSEVKDMIDVDYKEVENG